MHNNWLNNLMALHMYQEEIDKVDIRKLTKGVIAKIFHNKFCNIRNDTFSIVSKFPTSNSVKPTQSLVGSFLSKPYYVIVLKHFLLP